MAANRVGEIFSAAGTAFSKLGELTMHLHAAQEANQVGAKWDEEDIELLRTSVKRFGEDLNKLSESIKSKKEDGLKSGLKRKMEEVTTAAPVVNNIAGNLGSPPKKLASLMAPAVIVKPSVLPPVASNVITKPVQNNFNSAVSGVGIDLINPINS